LVKKLLQDNAVGMLMEVLPVTIQSFAKAAPAPRIGKIYEDVQVIYLM
jgi:hypothetical protein